MQLVGPYIDSFYRKRGTLVRFLQALLSFGKSTKLSSPWSSRVTSGSETLRKIVIDTELSETPIPHASYQSEKQFGKQEMLRDLFLWSVYAGYVDIAFVLLLQLKSRIGAALVAAGIAERLSSNVSNLDTRNTYNEHRIAYEEYATACIEACYRHNERIACELLLREIPLFGNITCMQVSCTYLSVILYVFQFFFRQQSHQASFRSLIQIALIKFSIDNGLASWMEYRINRCGLCASSYSISRRLVYSYL